LKDFVLGLKKVNSKIGLADAGLSLLDAWCFFRFYLSDSGLSLIFGLADAGYSFLDLVCHMQGFLFLRRQLPLLRALSLASRSAASLRKKYGSL
jgi:hypothetical protein